MTAPVSVLVADPPWPFKDRLPGQARGAGRHYGLLSIADLCSFAIPPIVNDALLLLWRVGAMQEAAVQVCRAWGFRPTTDLVWVKTRPCRLHRPGPRRAPAPADFRTRDCPSCTANVLLLKLHFGMGRTLRNCTEIALVGVRGRASRLVRERSLRNAILAPYLGHSRKPEEAQDLLDALVPDGPRAELFARRQRPGWLCLGDQADGRA